MSKFEVTVTLSTGEQHVLQADEEPTYPYLGAVTVGEETFADPRHVEVVAKRQSAKRQTKPRAKTTKKTAAAKPTGKKA